MMRVLGVALIAVAAVLLFFGLQATNTIGEKIVEGVTGKYTDHTMKYLIGGIAAGVIGLGMLILGGKRR